MRHSPARHLRLAVIAVAIATVFPLANVAFGATPKTVTNGSVKVINYGDGEGDGSIIVFTGAIGDGGFADTVTKNGTPDPNGGTEVHFALSQGSFAINIASLNNAINSMFSKLQPNARTCSLSSTLSNRVVKIVPGSGSGAYSGITGSFRISLSFAEVGTKYTSGKHNGQCNNSNSAPAAFSAMTVIGSGTVSY